MAKYRKVVKDLVKITSAELSDTKKGAKSTKEVSIHTDIDPRNNVDRTMALRCKDSRYYVTRNRRGQPPTSEVDEWIGPAPTGKIIVSSKFVDGKYVPIYRREEVLRKEVKKIKIEKPKTEKIDKFTKWFGDRFGDTSFPLDPIAVASYNKWVKERGTSDQSAKQTKVVVRKPTGKEYKVFVLEFDWGYGHEKEECVSKEHALERKERWIQTFSWSTFSNWKLYSELRFRKEIEITN